MGLIALHEDWEADQARLADLATWCARVADNLPILSYAAKRDALVALGVEARAWRTDHTPRWEVTMRVDDVLSNSSVRHSSNWRYAARRSAWCPLYSQKY